MKIKFLLKANGSFMRKFVLLKISRYMVGSYSLNSETPYECYLHVSEKASQDAKATNHVSASDQDVTSNPTPLPSPLPSDHQERASMGAESITSSEFETVSFTEENGEQAVHQRSEVKG